MNDIVDSLALSSAPAMNDVPHFLTSTAVSAKRVSERLAIASKEVLTQRAARARRSGFAHPNMAPPRSF